MQHAIPPDIYEHLDSLKTDDATRALSYFETVHSDLSILREQKFHDDETIKGLERRVTDLKAKINRLEDAFQIERQSLHRTIDDAHRLIASLQKATASKEAERVSEYAPRPKQRDDLQELADNLAVSLVPENIPSFLKKEGGDA